MACRARLLLARTQCRWLPCRRRPAGVLAWCGRAGGCSCAGAL